MKPITLTKQQEKKLLEMAKALFPENQTWRFTGNILEYSIKGNLVQYIHWFEFCIFHLVEKLSKAYGEAFYEMYYNHHPVDYLYSEFKKLKL